jgi:hypothetical protein
LTVGSALPAPVDESVGVGVAPGLEEWGAAALADVADVFPGRRGGWGGSLGLSWLRRLDLRWRLSRRRSLNPSWWESRGRRLGFSRRSSCNAIASASTTNTTHFVREKVVVVVLSASPRIGFVPRTIVIPRISCTVVAVFTLPRFWGGFRRDAGWL